MGLDEGDVVRFDYVLWTDGDEKPLDTSMEEVAEEEGIHREKEYQPVTVTLGQRQVLPALEQDMLENAAIDEERVLELNTDKAYGPRDPKKIQDIPMAQFRKQKLDPKAGMELQIQGQRGLVTRVAGGRVRVDLNHALAGKDLRYKYVVRQVLKTPDEKIEAVMQQLFPHGGYKVAIQDDRVDLELPDHAKFDPNFHQHKFRVVSELRNATGADRDVRLIENYPKELGQAPAAQEAEQES